MKTAGLILAMGLVSARVFAGGADDLIALDKAWGSAGGAADVEAMLSADLIAVDGEGLSGKAEQLEAMAEAPDGPYVAGDYKVNFIDGDTAVMVHSAGSGKTAHWSMHVWQKTGGHWQVMATASVKADD
jgi:hypothetical protein